MAVRIVALLIPLAITLPQLRTHTDAAPAPQEQAVNVNTPPAPSPEWSYDTRRASDAAFTRVVLDSPLHSAMSEGQVPNGAAAAPTKPAMRKTMATHKRAPAKTMASAKSSIHPAARKTQRPLLQAACPPATHCAPVVEANVTPVSRKSL